MLKLVRGAAVLDHKANAFGGEFVLVVCGVCGWVLQRNSPRSVTSSTSVQSDESATVEVKAAMSSVRSSYDHYPMKYVGAFARGTGGRR